MAAHGQNCVMDTHRPLLGPVEGSIYFSGTAISISYCIYFLYIGGGRLPKLVDSALGFSIPVFMQGIYVFET